MRAYNRRSTRHEIDMRSALLGIHGPGEEDYVICNINRKESVNYGQPFYNDVETGIDNIGVRRAYRIYWKQGSFHYWSNSNNEFFLNHSDVKEWLFNRFVVLKKEVFGTLNLVCGILRELFTRLLEIIIEMNQ